MLKARLVNRYQKNGGMVYVYKVSGNPEEVQQYIDDKANEGFEVVDAATGDVLMWSRKLIPGIVDVIHTEKQGYMLDNSYVQDAMALSATLGGAAGDEIAKVVAHEQLAALKATRAAIANARIKASTEVNTSEDAKADSKAEVVEVDLSKE
jgi:hypothetical protein